MKNFKDGDMGNWGGTRPLRSCPLNYVLDVKAGKIWGENIPDSRNISFNPHYNLKKKSSYHTLFKNKKTRLGRGKRIATSSD